MPSTCRRATAIAVAIACLLPGALPALAVAESCPRQMGTPAFARRLRRPIAMRRGQLAEPIKFGWKRGSQATYVVAVAARPLPPRIKPANLSLDLARPLLRQGDSLSSVQGIRPTFRGPHISASRRTLTFTVCVSGDSISAGTYTGSVDVVGPSGLRSASSPLSVAVKDAKLFWTGVLVALLVAAAFIAVKEAQEKARSRRNAESTAHAILLSWVVPLAAAFAAMYAIYAKTTVWGEDSVAAIITLVTTTLTAAGVRSLLTLRR